MSISPRRLPFTPVFDRVAKERVPDSEDMDRHLDGYFNDAKRFIVDDVVTWVLGDGKEGKFTEPEDLPAPIRMPYPVMWLEWGWGKEWAGMTTIEIDSSKGGEVVGVHDHAGGADPRHFGRTGALVREMRAEALKNPTVIAAREKYAPSATHVIRIDVLLSIGTAPLSSPWDGAWIAVFHDESGKFLATCDLMSAQTHANTAHVAMLENSMRLIMSSLAMMNCKNVSTDEHKRPAPKSKKQRRIRPDGLSYSTIKLPGHTYDNAGFVNSNGSGEEGVRAHTVRGHPATYTAEAPRFGRPDGVGTFWISPHVRGDRKKGEVEQTYIVGPLEEPEK